MLETCEKILKLFTSLGQKSMHVLSKGFTAHSSTSAADLIETKEVETQRTKRVDACSYEFVCTRLQVESMRSMRPNG